MAAALFSPVSTGRVSVEIVDRIKAAIRAGALAPGDQLPSERELTKQLGVSRVSVRDALRMLEANGLIEVRVGAKGGAFVTAPAPKLVGEGIADMLMLAADVDPAQITEARMVFELGMLELACARATDTDLAELSEICDRADAAFEAGTYEPALSAEFHARLARCTQNVALALFAESFQAPLAASLRRARAADPHAGRAGALEHRDLVTAIAARDATRAREIMAAHIGRTAARVGVGS
jgi:GntR family transcriptional regulator, transcriptional repressor for pyruvate dehydrogenase complex